MRILCLQFSMYLNMVAVKLFHIESYRRVVVPVLSIAKKTKMIRSYHSNETLS